MKCSNCGRYVDNSAVLSGRRTECPKCGTPLGQPSATSGTSKQRTSHKVSGANIIGVLVCLVGIVLIVWVSLIFGIVLFVLGILLLLAQQIYASRNPEKWNPKAFKQCPYCAEPVKREAVRCKHCGADISVEEPVQQMAANPPPQISAPSQFSATVQQDVIIDGTVAFRNGEAVTVITISPDDTRPEYRYVVHSALLNRQYRLSDTELYVQGSVPVGPSNSKGQSWR